MLVTLVTSIFFISHTVFKRRSPPARQRSPTYNRVLIMVTLHVLQSFSPVTDRVIDPGELQISKYPNLAPKNRPLKMQSSRRHRSKISLQVLYNLMLIRYRLKKTAFSLMAVIRLFNFHQSIPVKLRSIVLLESQITCIPKLIVLKCRKRQFALLFGVHIYSVLFFPILSKRDQFNPS